MGASDSKPLDQEPEEAQHISSVRVSPELLQQLAGQEQAPVGRASHATSDQPHSEAQRQQAAIEEALRSSRVAESSLQHSRRVGDLLLKNEDEEVQRVTEYAEELLNDEYRPPVRETPCEQARHDCVACYTQHPQDVLRCAQAVDAYRACADKAFKKFVGR